MWDVLRKVRRQDYVVVEVVFYKFSAPMTSMPVENPKDLDFRPILNFRSPICRLDNVQDDSDSILIGLPDSSNICIRCETSHSSEGLIAYLRRLKLLESC